MDFTTDIKGKCLPDSSRACIPCDSLPSGLCKLYASLCFVPERSHLLWKKKLLYKYLTWIYVFKKWKCKTCWLIALAKGKFSGLIIFKHDSWKTNFFLLLILSLSEGFLTTFAHSHLKSHIPPKTRTKKKTQKQTLNVEWFTLRIVSEHKGKWKCHLNFRKCLIRNGGVR